MTVANITFSKSVAQAMPIVRAPLISRNSCLRPMRCTVILTRSTLHTNIVHHIYNCRRSSLTSPQQPALVWVPKIKSVSAKIRLRITNHLGTKSLLALQSTRRLCSSSCGTIRRNKPETIQLSAFRTSFRMVVLPTLTKSGTKSLACSTQVSNSNHAGRLLQLHAWVTLLAASNSLKATSISFNTQVKFCSPRSTQILPNNKKS